LRTSSTSTLRATARRSVKTTQSAGSGRTTDRVRVTTTGATATSTPSATISRTTSASGRMTTSAEICLIQDHRATSVCANLEVPHLTWMNVATIHQHLCLALGTSGLACVVTSTKTRLSTLKIFPVAATVRQFAKTMKDASSSATRWTTRATMESAGSTTTVTGLLTTSARTA